MVAEDGGEVREYKKSIAMEFSIKAAGTAFLKDYKRLLHENQLLRGRIDQLMNGGNRLSSRVRESIWFKGHQNDIYITSALDEWDSLFHKMFQKMKREEEAHNDLAA